MEIDRINKYCHVSAYIAYDNCSPVYKQTFKFEISPSDHNSIVWDKISRKQLKLNPNKNIKVNEGVFVLNKTELNSLKLNKDETLVIKKYLQLTDVSDYN